MGPAPINSPMSKLEALQIAVSVLVVGVAMAVAMLPQTNGIIAGAVMPMMLGYALCVGLPVALAMRALGKRSFLAAIGGGAGVGLFPAGVIALGSGPAGLLFMVVLGTIAGALAWVVLKLQQMPSRVWGSRRPVLLGLASSLAVVALTAGGAVGGLRLIYGPKDMSCHNPGRDGRRSIGPVANASLDIPSVEWPRLRSLLSEAGHAGGWSVRDLSRSGDSFQRVSVSLCLEPGTNLAADQLLWRDQAPAIPGVYIGVYQPQGGTSWIAPARAVYRRISAAWPGKLTFKDTGGRFTDPPRWYCDDQEGLPVDPVLCPQGHAEARSKDSANAVP